MTSFKPSDELKQKLYVIIFKSDTKGGKLFDVLLLIVIVFSVLLSMLESIVEYDKQYLIPFRIGEWIITFLFTIEYILRIYCVPNKKKYIFSFYGIIDFLSILPAFISILFSSTRYFSIIRSLRLLRIFRILKLSRYVKESNHLAESIKRSAKKILLFSYFIIIMVTILGAIMYVVESKPWIRQYTRKRILGSRYPHNGRLRRYYTCNFSRTIDCNCHYASRLFDHCRTYWYCFFRNDTQPSHERCRMP